MSMSYGSGNETVADGSRIPHHRLFLAWGGPKILPCGDDRGDGLEGLMTGTSEMTLDLQSAIDSLRSLKGDLEAFYWDRSGDADTQSRERYQTSLWIRLVGERTAALEGIVMHLGTTAVMVSGVSPGELETLRGALTVLDRWIQESEPFDDVLQSVTAILNAADVLCLRAAGGRPENGGRTLAPE